MAENTGNTIEFFENGPMYIQGNLEVRNSDGETLFTKNKIALCRCGGSSNKPACDGTHKKAGFKAGVLKDVADIPATDQGNADTLVLQTMKNGPILVQGSYTLTSDAIGSHTSDKKIALCRCGGSSNKPFCDGTHKKIGFEAS